MASVETMKLDELLRRLPKNSGIDPRLVEEAKQELSILRVQAETNRTSRQVDIAWSSKHLYTVF